MATDPATLTGQLGAPYLAVDVQPDDAAGAFELDVSQLDGTDLLAWSDTDPGLWENIVCDVTQVNYRRGVARTLGRLTQVEAGTCTVQLADTEHAFDPMTNGDVIHKGTPLRLRAWGHKPILVPQEVRRNRVPNPQVAAALTGWTANYGTGGAGTLVRVATDGPNGGPFARATWTTTPTDVNVCAVRADGRSTSGLAFTVTPGEQVSAAIYARTSIDQLMTCIVTWFDAADVQVGSGVVNAVQVIPADTWTRLTAEDLTVPAGVARAIVAARSRSGDGSVLWPVGATLDATMAQLETGPTAGPYFDGTTPSASVAGGLAHSWTGTPNASASLESVLQPDLEAWSAVLFTGEVDEVHVAYQKADAPIVTLTGLDLVGPLAAWEAEGRAEPGTGAGNNLKQRAQLVLTETGRGTISPDSDAAYTATLAPVTLAQPWQNLMDAVEAELGRVWVDSANRLVVRGRDSELSGPVRGTLSDIHGEAPLGVHCCVADAAVVYGAERLANRVLAGRRHTPAAGVTDTDPDTLVRRDDTASQARYGVGVVERRGLDLQTDAQLGPWADAVIRGHTRPELRVDSVQPAPSTQDLDDALAAWAAVMQTDLGDRWLFRFHPTYGPTVATAVGVVGIEVEATPDAWAVLWTTAAAPQPDTSAWFTLDASELDSGDLLPPFD